ncbi:MAG TPA: DUF1232 domain-containing protein [Anaerolineae bacterium]|nr:DUF1232 domain-containing protein [Anaerolineae bacterium]
MADTTTKTATHRGADPTMLAEVWRSAQLVWRLMLDSRVPLFPKLILGLIILYVVSPLDVIPEAVFLLVGTLDDLAVLFLGTRLFIHLCPPDVVMEHRRAIAGGSTTTTKKDYVDGTYRVVDEDNV